VTPMVDTIQTLLDGAPAPSLGAIEETLTTGYAHALALEGERLRIERDLRSLIRTPGHPSRARVAEIRGLEARLTDADGELRRLRRLLATLRTHVADPS
jgi:hypothetical protein